MPRIRLSRLGVSISVLAALALGCRRDPPLPPAEPEVDLAGKEPIVESGTPLSEASALPKADAIATDDREPDPAPPWKIDLPQDAAFLATPRPAAGATRYASWKQRARIGVGKSHLQTALLSFDESLLFVMSGAEATVRVYDAKRRALLANHTVPGFTPGAWDRGVIERWPGTARGPAFLVGNTAGLHLVSAHTGRVLQALHPEPVWDLRWSPDTRVLISSLHDIGTQTTRLRVFARDGDRLDEVTVIDTEDRVDDIALSRDNTRAAITTYPADRLRYIDLTTGDTLWEVAAPKYCGSVDISPDGTRVAAGGAEVVIHDASDPSVVARWTKLGNNVGLVRFSPSGDALGASAYDGHARVLSTGLSSGKLKLLADLRHSGSANVYAVSWRSDGKGLITSSGDRTVREWGR